MDKKKTYLKNQEIFEYVIRVAKKDSAFIYFTLESNEGLCFYSTLKASEGEVYRDIEIKGAVEFEEQVKDILDQLQNTLKSLVIL